MNKKRIIIIAVLAVLSLGLLFQDRLIQVYVTIFHANLEEYSERLLDSGEVARSSYGFWKVSVYPEDNMVEFHTGGFGLAPSATYKGFYYSGDNKHKPFSAAYEELVTMEINGDSASWTDGTDNNGTSERMMEKWFWFGASF